MSTASTPQTVTPAVADVAMEHRSEPSSPRAPPEPLGLTIPRFAIGLTHPLSLNEEIHVIRKSRPTDLHFPSHPVPMDHDRDHSRTCIYLIENLPPEFTERSLGEFLRMPTKFLRFKILSVNENRGRFDVPLVANTVLSLPGTAIIRSDRSDLDHMLAYGRKCFLTPISSLLQILQRIYSVLKVGFLPPSSSEPQSKFGGGLGRKSASGGVGKFWIRSAAGLLSEDEWRHRGAVAVELDGEWTVAKFSRIEMRDAACDCFIVGIELTALAKFETGLSEINNELVLTENVEAESHFRHPSLESLFEPTSTPALKPTPVTQYMPPLPLPRSRR